MVIFSWLVETSRLNMRTLVLRTFSLFRTYTFIYLDKWLSNFQLILYLDTNEWIGLKKKRYQWMMWCFLFLQLWWNSQGCQFRTVPAGTAGIYRTGQQFGTFDPPVLYRKKYRSYRPRTDRTGQFRAIPADTEKRFFFFFLSFVIFEFLLG